MYVKKIVFVALFISIPTIMPVNTPQSAFKSPLANVTQSATNANWTVTLGTAVSSVYVFGIAAKKTG